MMSIFGMASGAVKTKAIIKRHTHMSSVYNTVDGGPLVSYLSLLSFALDSLRVPTLKHELLNGGEERLSPSLFRYAKNTHQYLKGMEFP
jgi:hypothetical protein